jgi:glycosyltransferase involved in cell wall biosynthesis
MTPHQPLVAVGVPVYNGEAYLEQRLFSILGQTFSDYELILCDNASTDGTASILQRIAAQDPRAKYIRQEQTVSPSLNFRRVFEESRAPYFLWAAADDLWEPEYLSTLVALLDKNPRAALAFTAFDYIGPSGETLLRRIPIDWRRTWSGAKVSQVAWLIWADFADQFERREATSGRLAAACCHVYGMMRREALAGIDEYYRSNPYSGADALALIALLCLGEFVVSDRILFHYRLRVQQVARRPAGAGLAYLRRRAVASASGHKGSLVSTLRRCFEYHAGVRSVIDRRAPFGWPARAALRSMDRAAQAAALFAGIPRAVLREIL